MSTSADVLSLDHHSMGCKLDCRRDQVKVSFALTIFDIRDSIIFIRTVKTFLF